MAIGVIGRVLRCCGTCFKSKFSFLSFWRSCVGGPSNVAVLNDKNKMSHVFESEKETIFKAF